MKKVIYISIFSLLFAFVGCNEEFLDQKNLYEQLDENFYSNPQDIFDALAAAYTKLTSNWGIMNYGLVTSTLGDDRLGGGGINDLVPHDIDKFTNSVEDNYLEMWQTNYEGIFRTNMIITRFDQAEYTNEQDRNRDLGEAHFLRAVFYYRLATLFGTVPLVTDPAPVNLPRATPAEIFAQIASDLKLAIELLPDIPYQQIPDEMSGRATRWAAQGIMARAYLFYTGYYDQSEMPLVEGGSITQTQVLAWLENCIQNSGHALLSDPRNLWPYTVPEIAADYPYVADNGLSYAGDDNEEIVFAVKYGSFSDWNHPGRTAYSNQSILYQGLRMNDGLVPFGHGWGFGPVNPKLWDSFEPGDVRQQGFILNMIDNVPGEEAIAGAYILGGQLGDPQQDETGHWSKKGLPVVMYDGANIKGYYFITYGGNDNMQHWNMQDDPQLRFADILLMAAELLGPGAGDTYLNEVRNRAGLGDASATLDNIKRERRHELCFEGLRYHDLLRWGDVEAAFAEATNLTIFTAGVEDVYTVQFNPERVFLKIPESQVRLSDGALLQYPGWE